jgi:cellulose synthase/poly-beta-1,6-N-acetylglucosamine synthase-like glycosyltransferase
MTLELVAYPFLFAAIYFEAFLLVTFLSAPAHIARTAKEPSGRTPSVAMIVPCWNEESTVAATAESLLALNYPKEKLRIVLVNDGSTDGTKGAMARFEGHPQVTVVNQENAGKHAGDAEIIGCLDADSFADPSALQEMVGKFDDEMVGAVTPAMSVHKPTTLLEHMQNAEFVLGIALRHILAAVNGLHVTPGPFSLYRRDLITRLGGFRFGYQTEDMEMALRIQKAGYLIESAHTARVFTKVPKTVPKLIKQRTRWTSGFLRNVLHDYRSLVGNPRYGALGTMILPLGFLAILGGILMACVVVYQVISMSISTYLRVAEVPLAFTLGTFMPSLSWFEWFYLPLTLFALLAFVAMAGSVLFILVGKRISKTPGGLGIGLIGYLLVYGLIAPFWLVRSVADVATNTKRTWR